MQSTPQTYDECQDAQPAPLQDILMEEVVNKDDFAEKDFHTTTANTPHSKDTSKPNPQESARNQLSKETLKKMLAQRMAAVLESMGTSHEDVRSALNNASGIMQGNPLPGWMLVEKPETDSVDPSLPSS